MTTVLARRPGPVSIRRMRLRSSVLDTLWFVPAVASVAAVLLSRATVALDRSGPGPGSVDALLPGDSSAVASAAATVATAMLTFLGVVFATTLVAIQLAASQYSPRIVRVFVHSRVTQVTLGIFLATFVFSLNTLVAIRTDDEPFVPAVTAVVMYVSVFATVAAFVTFMHHMVRLLRVQYLLRVTARASHDAIDESFPASDLYEERPAPAPDATPRVIRRPRAARRHRGTPRVVQAIDVAGIADAAPRAGCWVDLRLAPGAHVGPLSVVAEVHGDAAGALSDEDVLGHVLFGSERTHRLDPGFGVRQLVDTASRALSPAINDPTTAVQALHRVEDLLARIIDRPDPSGWFTAADRSVRVHMPVPSFVELARLGLTEILLYGGDAPQVTRALRATCAELRDSCSDERTAWVEDFDAQVLASVRQRLPEPFHAVASTSDPLGLG